MYIQEILDKVYRKDIRSNLKMLYLTIFPESIILSILLFHWFTLETILIAFIGTFMFFLIALISPVLSYNGLKKKIDKNVKVVKIIGKIVDIRSCSGNRELEEFTIKDVNNLEVKTEHPFTYKYFYMGDEVCLYIFKENDDLNENEGILVEKDFEKKYK